MKNKKIFVLLLCIFMMLSGFSAYAVTSNGNIESEYNMGNGGGYLSEEEVFEALASTYNDSKLLSAIDSSKVKTPSNFIISEFHAEDYSKYTNNQYGGMYMEENGELVLCYINGSDMLSKAMNSNEEFSGKLLNSSNKVIANSVTVKSVKYSYAELLKVHTYLNENANQHKGMGNSAIDIRNNKISIGVYASSEGKKAKRDLTSLFGEDMFSFVEIDPDDLPKFIANIGGTSEIRNNGILGFNPTKSTPAGRMYSPSKGYYGVITCAHGYTNGDSIYTGSTKIGQITGRILTSSNDSSFIKLDSGHTYTENDELSSNVPVVGSYITLRGKESGTKGAKVTDTNASMYDPIEGVNYTNMILVDKGMQNGDSGGGAIGGAIDGGRTHLIVGINRMASSSQTWLVKGGTVWNGFR